MKITKATLLDDIEPQQQIKLTVQETRRRNNEVIKMQIFNDYLKHNSKYILHISTLIYRKLQLFQGLRSTRRKGYVRGQFMWIEVEDNG